MRDIDLVDQAITETQGVLQAYIEPGPRDAAAAMQRLIEILDRDDLVAALERLRQGFGPRAVK